MRTAWASLTPTHAPKIAVMVLPQAAAEAAVVAEAMGADVPTEHTVHHRIEAAAVTHPEAQQAHRTGKPATQAEPQDRMEINPNAPTDAHGVPAPSQRVVKGLHLRAKALPAREFY